MAVTGCIEQDLDGKRQFRVSLADGRVCRRTFLVQSNDAGDNEETIFAGAQVTGPKPLPAPFSLFPGSSVAYSHDYQVIRDKMNRKTWMIIVEYKTIFSQQEIDRSKYDDPLDRPTLISGKSRTIMIAKRSGLRFGPYTTWPGGSPTFAMATNANSAGDPLDPPIEFPQTEWELHCEKNVGALPSWVQSYNNGVNNADQTISILGASWVLPKGLCKLSNLTFSTPRRDNDVDYLVLAWDVTARLPRPLNLSESSAPSPWDTERLDEGMRTRAVKGSGYEWKNVMDSTGAQSVTTPVPFNGNGVPISTGSTAISESDLKRYCYRNCPFVDYGAIPWS